MKRSVWPTLSIFTIQECLSRCTGRYIDAWNTVSVTYAERFAQQLKNAQAHASASSSSFGGYQ
jgi:hypothetical protein